MFQQYFLLRMNKILALWDVDCSCFGGSWLDNLSFVRVQLEHVPISGTILKTNFGVNLGPNLHPILGSNFGALVRKKDKEVLKLNPKIGFNLALKLALKMGAQIGIFFKCILQNKGSQARAH